jgi:hypothetical protein
LLPLLMAPPCRALLSENVEAVMSTWPPLALSIPPP